MPIKTYAARGLLDLQMALNVGGAILRICFSGGYMGSTGVVAAKYVTDNEALQKIIEKTRQFDKGQIYLFKSVMTKAEEEEEKERNREKKGNG